MLYNIYLGENNGSEGNEALRSSIMYIAKALKHNGWFCFVEVKALRQSSEIEKLLLKAGFEFESPRQVFRPYKTLEGICDDYPYLIYHCKKIGSIQIV